MLFPFAEVPSRVSWLPFVSTVHGTVSCVYRLLCAHTVDEKILSILERKQADFNAFADESVAAKESIELDEKTIGDIIQEEIDRINAKHKNQLTEKEGAGSI